MLFAHSAFVIMVVLSLTSASTCPFDLAHDHSLSSIPSRDRDLNQRSVRSEYKCPTHGHYREYTDYLNRLKNWCLVWTTMAILPLTVLLYMMGVCLSPLPFFPPPPPPPHPSSSVSLQFFTGFNKQ